MKKYVKPELFYERYELSENIAACAWDLNSGASCGFTGGDLGMDTSWVFFDDALIAEGRACDLNPPMAYCYTNGAPGMNTFNS